MTDPPQLCTAHCCRLHTTRPRRAVRTGGGARSLLRAHRARRGRHGGTRDPIRCALPSLLLRCCSPAAGGPEGPGPERPQPYWGSRTPRHISLIFVITGVEAGDRGPSRRSGAKSTCWPGVGNRRLPVVDTWTSRRPCTATPRRPRPVPRRPPGCPQSVPTPAGRPRATGRGARREAVPGTRSAAAGTTEPQVSDAGRPDAHAGEEPGDGTR
jgi:hypothetical protein